MCSMNWLAGLLGGRAKSHCGKTKKLRPCRQLELERLEDRTVPTAGALDPLFGTGGKVITDLGAGSGFATAVAVQQDGKIVVAGYIDVEGGRDIAVVRYTATGDLDSSFGNAGHIAIDFGSHADQAYGVAVQPDGKIVVAGQTYLEDTTGWDFAVARLNADGTLDTSFVGDGMRTVDFGTQGEFGYGLALQGDGRIVLIGSCYQEPTGGDFAVARLNPDGSLDTSFDTDGKQAIDFESFYDTGNGVAVQPDGSVVVVGYTHLEGTGFDMAVARLSNNGTLDTAFAGDGTLTIDGYGGEDSSSSVAIQADGKILVGGYVHHPVTGFDLAVVRLDEDGSLDASFGDNGKSTVDYDSPDDGSWGSDGLALQADGKIVLVGFTLQDATSYDFAVARLNSDGSPDSSFDDDGKVITVFDSSRDEAFGVALQPDGKIVVVGGAQQADDAEFAVARYIGSMTVTVQIDIKPGDAANTVNVSSNGTITVALFGSATFDVALVDVGAVRFADALAYQHSLQDVNGDGFLDMVLKFRTQDTSLGALYAQLLAEDLDGAGMLDSSHQPASVSLTGSLSDASTFVGSDELDLFLSGRALRELLDQLAAEGAL